MTARELASLELPPALSGIARAAMLEIELSDSKALSPAQAHYVGSALAHALETEGAQPIWIREPIQWCNQGCRTLHPVYGMRLWHYETGLSFGPCEQCAATLAPHLARALSSVPGLILPAGLSELVTRAA